MPFLENLLRTRRSPYPMIIPPALPYASQQREFYDLPMPEETKDNRYDGRFRYDRHLSSIPILTISRPVVYQLTPEIIRTCTPDCSASHCTTECKCANTHPAVHAKCNPPPSADFVGICQAWYAKCPMYEQLHY